MEAYDRIASHELVANPDHLPTYLSYRVYSSIPSHLLDISALLAGTKNPLSDKSQSSKPEPNPTQAGLNSAQLIAHTGCLAIHALMSKSLHYHTLGMRR